MADVEEMFEKYRHKPDEYPILMNQTHKVIKNGSMVNERININENLIHYVQDTALLISEIDASLSEDKKAVDHVVYLDKSARPVSWLVNMFWTEFAVKDAQGKPVRRPAHTYVNIDRSPWFRKVGINVSDDGRQKENGELATYNDFVNHAGNLTQRHLAEVRALFIEGGIEDEDVGRIMESPTILDGKRVLIVDEVSRTGSTLNIAVHIFKLAFPEAEEIRSVYFWHPAEPPLKAGHENVLTSLPVWYDPNTLTGRGIGGTDEKYYRQRYEFCLEMSSVNQNIDIKKLRTQAFSASVFSAPLLKEDGSVLNLKEEKKTRELCRDLKKLVADYRKGEIFFVPPYAWIDLGRYESLLERQGVRLIPETATEEERNEIRQDPRFFLNFIQKLKTM
ncbi:MAG: phosphoribosyltransferase domain-containing protein [Lachnospiraceae bacterium]|nr:phosphoribosyltransferase domain-containing protein [Lachnospiraceae bacterium]